MLINILKSKIHRATVTESNLNYIGSIGIDHDLMDKVGIRPNEQVQVVDVNNGNRWTTYALPAERGSRKISVNGGSARLSMIGDKVIIMAFGLCNESEQINTRIVVLDDKNEIASFKDGDITN